MAPIFATNAADCTQTLSETFTSDLVYVRLLLRDDVLLGRGIAPMLRSSTTVPVLTIP